MVDIVPSAAHNSTEANDHNGRNSPASAVCYQLDVPSHAEAGSMAPPSPGLLPTRPAGDRIHASHPQAPTMNEDHGPTNHFLPLLPESDIPPPHLTRHSATGSMIEPSTSSEASISHLDLTSITSSPQRNLEQRRTRPVPHHTISSTSTASSATIKPSSFESTLPLLESASSQRSLPIFPDQSYAALQGQKYPVRIPSHTLRSRSSNPSPYSSYFASAVDQREYVATTPSGSRTAGNSPSGSPSLFTPPDSPHRHRLDHDDASGTYSSPYLHYTHRQVPKETHIADIDYDPVSGRKVINQYEIVDELGRGVHGKVKLGRILPDGDLVAIKIVERYSKRKRLGKNTNHEDKIKKEIAILKKARHPNIVSLLEVIDDPQRKKVYIILEFVELGEVAWRTPGEPEIGLIEYRRYLRDLYNMTAGEEAAAEERLILEEAERKRETARRRRQMKRELKNRSEAKIVESWSLEHQGEESDADGQNFDTLSQISSATSASQRSANQPNELVDVLDLAPPPDRPVAIRRGVRSTDFATPVGLGEPAEIYGKPKRFLSSDELDTITATGLEGTMYGAYDDTPQNRTPKVEGNSPRVLEDPQHTVVPEHFKHVPLLTINQARACFRDTVLGLEYLHFQGVIHRDIKPANLLQTKDHRIKISDFGVSYLGRERRSTDPNESESEVPDIDEAVELAKTVGTPAFYAPELCQTDTDGPTPPVTQQIDVWSLGVTLYCLIFGRVPFHDHNPFVIMHKIAEEEVRIPRWRLRAVPARKSSSRPSSRLESRKDEKRAPHALEYDAVDDDLYDLLRRLFIKDPRKRINLTEVKHHPWVLSGIRDPYSWLQETDPSRDEATRIEVSQEDVADAVVQLNLVERTMSTLRRVGNALGIGRSSSTRARAKSSATDVNSSNLSSAASSSSTISQDARRASMRPDESIFSALRAAREAEHPLAQSETASPELLERGHYFASVRAPPSQSEPSDNEDEHHAEYKGDRRISRPLLSERAVSANLGSNSGSKTLRPKDVAKSFGLGNLGMGNMTYPALPSTPRGLDSPGASGLAGILDKTGKKLIKSLRNRDRSTPDRDLDDRDQSADRTPMEQLTSVSSDSHAEPSLGISIATASGELKQPEVPDSQLGSSQTSPVSSHTASVPSPGIHKHKRSKSRQSSRSSITSATYRPVTASRDIQDHSAHLVAPTNPADEFDRAREESFRRRMVEELQQQERPPSSAQRRPLSALSPGECPPSPDDEIFYRRQREELSTRPRSATYDTTSPPAMPQFAAHILPIVTPSSSEDHLTSGLSQSTSNPSIPSVVSANSSLMQDPDDGLTLDLSSGSKESSADPASDSSTIYTRSASRQRPAPPHHSESHHDDDDGYIGDGDAAVESGAESDSDDSFIEMTRRKGRDRQQGSGRSESFSVGELGRHRERKPEDATKGGRSGSNGTMKKIRSRSLSSGEEILKTAQST